MAPHGVCDDIFFKESVYNLEGKYLGTTSCSHQLGQVTLIKTRWFEYKWKKGRCFEYV